MEKFSAEMGYSELLTYRGFVIAVNTMDVFFAALYHSQTEKIFALVDEFIEGDLDDLIDRSKILIDAWHIDAQIFEKTKHMRDGYSYQMPLNELKEKVFALLVVENQLLISF